MTRSAQRLLGVLLAILVAAAAAPAAASGDTDASGPVGPQTRVEDRVVRPDEATAAKVLILSVPRLTWADLEDGIPPSLARLLRRSAVGSLSPRTIGPTTTLGEGYVSIGAGNRATLATRRALQLQPWIPDGEAGLALGVDERFSGEAAGRVFTRRTGVDPGQASVVHIGMPTVTTANERLLYDAVPGSLGSALRKAGLSGAVIANADLGESGDGPAVLQREAALAVVDEVGRAGGRVDQSLLERAPGAPFGHRLAREAVLGAFQEAWSDHDVVLVEASDLERADAFRAVADRQAAATVARDALDRFDELLGEVLRQVDLDRDLVIIAAPAPPRGRTELLVAAMAGPGVEPGSLRSATTRRSGYVTLPDIAPTVLDALGVDPPTAMTGALMSSAGGRPFTPPLVGDFVEDNEKAIFRDRVTGLVTAAFIVFQLIVYALAAVAFSRKRRGLLRLAGGLSLMVLAFPPLAFLSGTVPYHRLSPLAYLAAMFVASLLLAVAAARIGEWDPQAPPLALLGVSFAVLIVDIVTGGSLQLNTVFGYSPIVAGRFAGFGNLASALVTVTAILLVTGVWGVARRRDPTADGPRRIVVAGGVLFIATLMIIGFPTFGSDVGGVLTNVPAFTAALLLIAGIRIGWRRSVLIACAAVVALGAFAAIDLARPPEVRTHLGRLVSRTLEGGTGELLVTFERKAAANVSILTSSIWTYAIPITLAFLAFLVWRPQGFLRGVIERFPGVRAGLIGSLVGGILGFALNDSGVAIPAMMLGVLLPHVAWLVARTSPRSAPEAQMPEGTRHGAGT